MNDTPSTHPDSSGESPNPFPMFLMVLLMTFVAGMLVEVVAREALPPQHVHATIEPAETPDGDAVEPAPAAPVSEPTPVIILLPSSGWTFWQWLATVAMTLPLQTELDGAKPRSDHEPRKK